MRQFINPTPARNLINKFYYQLPNNGFLKEGLLSCDRRYKEAITCAIVCVNEILNEFPQGFNGNFEEKRKKYWREVKQELIQIQNENT